MWVMTTLDFEDYVEPFKVYLQRESEFGRGGVGGRGKGGTDDVRETEFTKEQESGDLQEREGGGDNGRSGFRLAGEGGRGRRSGFRLAGEEREGGGDEVGFGLQDREGGRGRRREKWVSACRRGREGETACGWEGEGGRAEFGFSSEGS
ncbi:hypothetical protein I3760_09G083200 [Carya illinoinensis]|nr:hypothetical protein I3760_09G083200 [Carya illinoinensis]